VKKRRHHYVWQHYLRAWAVDGRVACLRDGTVFASDTANLAIEKDFYRLRELTDADLVVVEGMLTKATPALQKLHQGWVTMFTALAKIRRAASDVGLMSEELEQALAEATHNLEEDLHAGIETSATTHLDALRTGDLDFLGSPEEFGQFAYFLGVQHMRTKKRREAPVAAVADIPIPGFDMNRAWGVLSHIFATNIGYGVMSRRAATRVTVLEAPSEAPFITADQPVVNLRAHGKPAAEETTELTMYYPVSAGRALLLEVDQGDGEVESRQIDAPAVGRYNGMLYEMSHEQVFASSKGALARWRTR